jgi:hypothetical protein
MQQQMLISLVPGRSYTPPTCKAGKLVINVARIRKTVAPLGQPSTKLMAGTVGGLESEAGIDGDIDVALRAGAQAGRATK